MPRLSIRCKGRAEVNEGLRLGTSSEKKTGLSGNISHTRGGGLTHSHLFMFVYQVFFACQNHPEVLKHSLLFFFFHFGTSSEKNGILSKKFPYWGGWLV